MLTSEDKEEIKRMILEIVAGESRHSASQVDPIVEVTARAVEVFGTGEKALRWLKTPVRALGGQTPLSLLDTPAGIARVQDTLGQVEHGVW